MEGLLDIARFAAVADTKPRAIRTTDKAFNRNVSTGLPLQDVPSVCRPLA